MAKFADIYKQELKSKGILSSLGSAALKRQRERNDIRNTLFGGKGILSSTGQKIFGKGYSALGGGAQKLSASDSSPQQTAAMNGLTISSQRQEGLLKIVAKNTMNMNMMARDMNITRQNIASMTKKMTGKSSKGADALWMGADKRNAFFADKKTPTNTKQSSSSDGGGFGGIFSGIGSVIAGGAGIVGSVLSGLLGVVGSAGGGILRMVGSILGGIPGGWLLGTIALAGVAYLLKEVSDNVDFSTLKNDILKGLGLDPDNKEKTIKQQILERLGFSTETSKSISDSIENFDKEMMKVFQPAADKFELYAKSAFTTLTKIFENVGKTFGFVINDFFADNKLAIITSLAVGLAAAAGITLGAGKIAGMVAGLGAGLVLGKATSNIQSPDSLQNTINILDRLEQIDKEQQESRRKTDEAIQKHRENLNPLTTAATRKAKENAELMHEQGSKARLDERNKLIQENPLAGIDLQGNEVGFQDPTGSRRKMLRDLRDKMLKERKESLNFNPVDIFKGEVNKNSPVNLKEDQLKNAKIIYEEFIKAGYSDAQAKAAIANAMSESQLDATIQSRFIKNGVREESYGLFQINRKSHPEYSVEDLKDPRKNTRAILEIMDKEKTSGTFRRIMDGANATEFFMKYVENPTDQTDPKVLERINNFNRINGMQLSSLSTELNDGTRTLTLGDLAPSPSITVGPTNNIVQSGGGRSASAYDMEGLFVETMVYRNTAQA
jgi:hypothetical protein